MMSKGEVALIGFGEAGQAFCRGWGPLAVGLRVFDSAPPDSPRSAALRAQAADLGAQFCQTPAEALMGARCVFVLVTADQAVAAARTYAPHLAKGALWFDGNSCAPGSKAAASEAIGAVGGQYVDMAIMAPVHPKLNRTPVLTSGPGSAEAMAVFTALEMNARRLDGRVGSASSVKMLRSVMIKGIEALNAECLLAATKAGVTDEVLASLQASNPEVDWAGQAGYTLERMMQHGTRRAAEMQEVVRTLEDLGLPATISAAVAGWQGRIGALGLKDQNGGWPERTAVLLDRLKP